MGRKRREYLETKVGWTRVLIKLPDPGRRPGAAKAEQFATSLNQRREWALQIQQGAWAVRRIYGAWCAVHAVLSASLRNGRISRKEGGVLSPESVRRFRRFAAAAPVRLDVTDWGGPIVDAGPGGDEARAVILHMLWELIESRARDRLKYCLNLTCRRWFADETKNCGGIYCSRTCKDRTWNRTKRRNARHGQYRAPRARHGRHRELTVSRAKSREK